MARYSVKPFSGAKYAENAAKCKGDEAEWPCAICGRPINTEKDRVWAVVVDGGAAWGDETSDENDPGHMGAYPVGPDCHRRFVVGGSEHRTGDE